MARLTKKQQLFVAEYLIDLNATQVAIRAGYSPNSARQIADQNLSKLDIKNASDKVMAVPSSIAMRLFSVDTGRSSRLFSRATILRTVPALR